MIKLSLLALTVGISAHAATLIHRYDFNDNAYDSEGSLHGVLSSDNASLNLEAPAFGTSDLPTDVNPSSKKAIEFGMTSGKASSLSFENISATEIFDGKAGSFSYWFKADDMPDPDQPHELFSNISYGTGLRTSIMHNGKLRLAGMDGNDIYIGFGVNQEEGVTANKWHHLVVAWDDNNGKLKVALDGSIKTLSFANGALDDPSRLIFGNFESNSESVGDYISTQFHGKLYDLQIYQGMLSDDAINTLATQAGLAVPEPQHYGLIIGFIALGFTLIYHRLPAI